MSLNDIIPAKYRKPIYVVYALVGVALGAIATAYGPDNVPDWHAVTSNVYLYIGGAFGLTAAANTLVFKRVGNTDDAEEIDPEDFDDVPLDEEEDIDTTPVDDDYEPRH